MKIKTLALLAIFAGVVVLLVALMRMGKDGSGKIDASNEFVGGEAVESEIGVGYLLPREIGEPAVGQPWVTDLTIVDLDQDGLLDVVVSEGRANQVSWIRQYPLDVYTESHIGGSISGPAHVEVVDIDEDGDLDVLVASMGIVTPNDQKIGSVVILENDGNNRFTNRVILEQVDRVTYVEASDLDMDGDLDLSVGQFGYYEGEVRWMENHGD